MIVPKKAEITSIGFIRSILYPYRDILENNLNGRLINKLLNISGKVPRWTNGHRVVEVVFCHVLPSVGVRNP